MRDPYQAPHSDVRVTERPPKTLWKVFFWMLVLLEFGAIASTVFDSEMVESDLALEVLVYGVILIGIFGFAYDKRIFFARLWVLMIPVGLCYDLYVMRSALDWITPAITVSLFAAVSGVVLLVLLVIMFFQYLALFRYGCRSPEIWASG